MIDSLFTIAIPSKTMIFGLDFRRFDVQQDRLSITAPATSFNQKS
jgi:hypothetical protein